MSEGRSNGRRRRHTGSPRIWRVIALVGLLVVIASALVWRATAPRPPSAAQLISLLKDTRANLTQLSCTLHVPWPEAFPAAGGLPGARTLLAPAGGERVTALRWMAGTGTRTEVVLPADAAGSLTIHDGTSWWSYSPLLNLVLTAQAEGPPPLYIDELLAMIEGSTELRLLGRSTLDGHAAALELSGRLPDGSELRLDVDPDTGMPLRARRFDSEGRLLGMLEVRDLDLSPGIGAGDFAFSPPEGARVVAGALPQAFPDVAAAAASAQLTFAPRTPGTLPRGFALATVNLVGAGDNRALVLTYSRSVGEGEGTDALFTLTQTRAGAGWAPLPYGRPEQRGAWQGQVFELGELNGVDWRSGDVALTLLGTLSISDLIAVALTIP